MLLLVEALPVLAIADPTSGPTIVSVDVYRHCLETDDMLVVVDYYLNYTSNPAESITQAYLGRLMNGATELASVMPYAYYDKGYDYGMFAMYLDATDAAGLWGTGLTVRFEGNPTLSWPIDPPSTVAVTFTWHATTTAEATEIMLGSSIISEAGTLGSYWSVSLTAESASGTKLSEYGEQYFTNVIPGLREITPNIFSGSLTAPEFEEETYTQSYRDTLLNRWSTTLLKGVDQFATWTTLPTTVARGILWMIPTLLVAYWAGTASQDMRSAMFLALPMLFLGNLLGMLSLTFTNVGALLCAIALGYAILYQKSA
jgi:hypothetical protein